MQRWLEYWRYLSMRQTSAGFPGAFIERGPTRALGTALVTATVALAILLSPSVASAQFDFTLTTLGPQNVVQGRPLYFVLTAAPVSGTSPTLLPIAVTGLPAGVTVSFPDIAQTCCGTNQIYSLNSPVSTAIQIQTSATTPVGPATLMLSVTAGTVTRSVSYPITVTAPPSPLSRQPYAPASSIPQLALWQSNMTTYGQTFCNLLSSTSVTANQKLNTTYYDSQRVFYNIRDYTGAASWDACALSAQATYRDAYVIPNNGGVPGYWDFPHGLAQGYARTNDAASKNALLLLSHNAAFGTASVGKLSFMISPVTSREIAYHAMAYLLARAVNDPPSAVGDTYTELMLGHMEQWFVSKSYRTTGTNGEPAGAAGQLYIQPFMVAITAEALIAVHESAPDARIVTAVKTAMDWLWANAWMGASQSFSYDLYGPAAGPYQGLSPAPDLNLLIAPAYAWLYKETGDVTYRNRADAIFVGGVTQAAVSFDGKHFNQQYRWSFDYVKWRNPGSAPAAPTGLLVR